MATIADLFDTIEAERITEDGKAAVRMAQKLFKSTKPETIAEARQWLKLSLDFDRSLVDRELKKAQDEKKRRRRRGPRPAKRPQLKAVNGTGGGSS